MNEFTETGIPADSDSLRARGRAPFAVVLALGVIAILVIPGRALLPGRTLLPLDLLHQALLPWANDVRDPEFSDQYGIDAVQEYLPTHTFVAHEFREGRVPTWNPYNRAGSPYLDNPVRIPFHPLDLLLTCLSPDQVYDLSVVLHFGFAFFSMAWYLRAVGLRAGAVLFGALSWTFCSFFVINCLHGRSIAAISLLPLMLLCLERFLAVPKAARVWQLGVVLGFGLLIADPAGILAIAIVLALKLCGYRVFEAHPLRGRLRGLAWAGLIAFAAAAPALLSEAEGLATSVRTFDYSIPYAWSQSVMRTIGGYLALLVSAVHPYALGSRDTLDALKPFGYTIAFVPFAGSFALVFAVAAARQLRGERRWRWLLLTLAAGIVLQYPPIVDLLAQRNVIVITFALVIAAALGMDRFLGMTPREKQAGAKALLGITILIWAAFLCRELALQELGPRLMEMLTKTIRANLPGYLFERYYAWKLGSVARFLALQHIWSPPNLLFLTGLTALWAAWYRAARTGSEGARRLVVAVACLAPVLYGAANVHVIDEGRFPLPSRPPYLHLAPTDLAPPRVLIPRDGVADRLLLTALLPELFGLAQVRGYGSLFPLNPAVLTNDLSPRHPLFEVLGVNYLLTARDSTATSPAFGRKVYGGEMNVYARAHPASRFHLASRLVQVGTRQEAVDRARADTRSLDRRSFYLPSLPPGYGGERPVSGNIRSLDESPTRIDLELHTNTGALLVVGDTYYPGWSATVDGTPATIYPVDGTMRGIWVHAGTDRVRLRYVHWPSRVGFALQLGLLASVLLRMHGRRRRGAESSDARTL